MLLINNAAGSQTVPQFLELHTFLPCLLASTEPQTVTSPKPSVLPGDTIPLCSCVFLFRRMQGSKVCIIWPPTLIAGAFFSKRWRDVPQEQVSIIHWFRWGYVCYVYVTELKATAIIVLLIALCFCAVPTANGTAGSQLSTPRSGKSPSPSPTSPASLRRRRVIYITEILLDLSNMIIYRLRLCLSILYNSK